MIKQIVFDMGNVLIEWDPDEIIARFGVRGEGARRLRREVFDCSEWVSMDRGTMDQDEGLARICRRLPEDLHGAAERCVRDWRKGELTHMEGVEPLIREIHELGYGLYILSNATSCLHEYYHRLPAFECFQGLIVSADVKLLKPQREIYDTLFREYRLDPAECFFIDDNPANVEASIRAGMPAVVFFNDVPRLRRQLREAGVPVKEK
jgi:putative hydrolase of the HAD superfamily